ncbi:Arc family DNA-binding protein [Daeguia caeni]|uniref:Arc family DNA-binding protein n=1 Tax=Daeguia caeni TaxID=439612 RepID=A0ABV9H4G2_9HYPH
MNDKIGSIAPFGLRMPQRIKDWVSENAAKHDRSMNYIILRILEKEMAATGEGLGNSTPVASSNNTALQGGASINHGL